MSSEVSCAEAAARGRVEQYPGQHEVTHESDYGCDVGLAERLRKNESGTFAMDPKLAAARG